MKDSKDIYGQNYLAWVRGRRGSQHRASLGPWLAELPLSEVWGGRRMPGRSWQGGVLRVQGAGVGARARTHGAEGSKGGRLLARKASCMGRVLMRLSVKASGQSVVRWPREPLLPQRLSPSPTPGLAGPFTSPAHQPSGRSHCPSGCPQQIGPGTGKRHMWYHIQEPYGSHPHLVSTLLGTPGLGQGCEPLW